VCPSSSGRFAPQTNPTLRTFLPLYYVLADQIVPIRTDRQAPRFARDISGSVEREEEYGSDFRSGACYRKAIWIVGYSDRRRRGLGRVIAGVNCIQVFMRTTVSIVIS